MGTVWRAHDEHLDREVAVKELILPEDLDTAGRQTWIARLDREARAAARLKHPGVITVHDRVASEDGRPWIVMELVHGRSLDDLVKRDGPLAPERVAHIGLQALAAIRAVHEMGITHRDIKPSNVLLEGDRVVLTDFGIAAVEGDVNLTRSGAIMGTPAFMAPEQVRGLPATAESDLWSLGATLYTAVEGRPPFAGTSPWAVFVAVATEDPGPAVHAGPLAPVLTGLLRKDPAQRLTAEAAHELLAELARDAEPLPQERDSAPPPVRGAQPTRRLAAAGLAAGDSEHESEHEWEPAPARKPPGQGRTYLLGGLTAIIAAALIAIPTRLLWPDSSRDDGARNGSSSAPSSPSPSPSPPPSPSASASGPSSPAVSSVPSPSTSTPTTAAPTGPAYPAHTPLDRAAIDRIFGIYMNGLANHDMTALRSGTCPRLRSTLLGFALNGYYVARWELLPYEIPTGRDALSVEAKITQRDPDTGKLAGDVHYQWIIERDPNQNYWVCGWLNEE
ncbi:serine/threonine-protein kinase [Streptomyces sp. NPDC002990]